MMTGKRGENTEGEIKFGRNTINPIDLISAHSDQLQNHLQIHRPIGDKGSSARPEILADDRFSLVDLYSQFCVV
jgi:hypothetical protein